MTWLKWTEVYKYSEQAGHTELLFYDSLFADSDWSSDFAIIDFAPLVWCNLFDSWFTLAAARSICTRVIRRKTILRLKKVGFSPGSRVFIFVFKVSRQKRPYSYHRIYQFICVSFRPSEFRVRPRFLSLLWSCIVIIDHGCAVRESEPYLLFHRAIANPFLNDYSSVSSPYICDHWNLE